jgi:hypothetical protein
LNATEVLIPNLFSFNGNSKFRSINMSVIPTLKSLYTRIYIYSDTGVKNVKIRIYKTIILPVVLYECETWSLTLTGEHRLRVFENRVLCVCACSTNGEKARGKGIARKIKM